MLKALQGWVRGTWLENIWLRNTLLEWLIALAVCAGVFVAIAGVRSVARRRARFLQQQDKSTLDDLFVQVVASTRWYGCLAAGVYFGAHFLRLRPRHDAVLDDAVLIAFIVQIGAWLQALLSAGVAQWGRRHREKSSATLAATVRFIARLVIWAGVMFFVLSTMGVKISALLAGVGIGGIATALAVQGLLGDVFASLSMYFDRPFDMGDFIIVDDFSGTVEKVGLRTTRIRSLGGEQIVMANGDLVRARIRNFARLSERRILFSFGIEYNLPADKIQQATELAREAISAQEGVRLDRVHFKEFGPHSLNFEAVYYVLSDDYAYYMGRQHEINLAICRRFEAAKIPFAFPTRTLHVRGGLELFGDAPELSAGPSGNGKARRGSAPSA